MKQEIYKQAYENRESQERIKKCYDAFHKELKEKEGKARIIVNNKTCWLDREVFDGLVNSLDNEIKRKDKEFDALGEKDISKFQGLSFIEVIQRIKKGEEYQQIVKDTAFNYIKIYYDTILGLRIGLFLIKNDEPLDIPFDSVQLDGLRFKQTKQVKKKTMTNNQYRESKFIF